MFKDYVEMVWKPSWEWLKKYWLGYTIFIILLYTAVLFIFCREIITDWIRSIFHKLLGFEKEEPKEKEKIKEWED